jgi:TIR domain/Pentapeptide repeats (8 copies)
MANPEHLAKLKEGVEAWNQWRREYLSITPDLSDADLGWANLTGALLGGANLRSVELSHAKLRGADLRRADLTGADLSGAFLGGADLLAANLTAADLSGAFLGWANLTVATLSGADLRAATLIATIFVDTNLTNVHGLDTCFHRGPSTLDHSTFSKSGRLPLPFLRGCGLPDILIEFLPSLLNDAIQFYSCFISYSTSDQDFADRLHADLQNKGVRCWFAPHDIQSGKKIHEQIDTAIQMHDRLLLLLSDASINSEWVKTEIAKAREREIREQRRMLFPVRLVKFDALRQWKCFDADTGKDSAKEIREYYVPDFSDWKNHDSYQKEFERLLKDLKTDEKQTSSPSQK